jgi:hypothetical protein
VILYASSELDQSAVCSRQSTVFSDISEGIGNNKEGGGIQILPPSRNVGAREFIYDEILKLPRIVTKNSAFPALIPVS